METTELKDKPSTDEAELTPAPSFEQPRNQFCGTLRIPPFHDGPEKTSARRHGPRQGRPDHQRYGVYRFRLQSRGLGNNRGFSGRGRPIHHRRRLRSFLTLIEYTPSGARLGTTLRKALGTPGRDLLQRAYEADLPVVGDDPKVNKGGLEVDIGGARAFCPLSQIDLYYCENPEALVGTNQKFQVLRIEEEGMSHPSPAGPCCRPNGNPRPPR